jgi:hypothetical protein
LNNSTGRGMITISGTAHHNQIGKNVVKVFIKIDDGEWQTAQGTAKWRFQWNTYDDYNGRHNIQVRAYDGEDYSGTIPWKINVDNKSINIDRPFQFEYVIIILIFMIIFILIIKRKKMLWGHKEK